MRKICLLLTMMGCFLYLSAVPVPLGINFDDTTGTIPGNPRGPVLCPNVDLDAHTLYLYNVGYDLTLVLLDENDDEAYTTFISAGTSAVVLPATLSGDYEIQLYPEGTSYYFFGWVEL